jgi:hypothetical protein
VRAIEVEAERLADDMLVARFFVNGELGNLRLPGPVEAARTDELWRHTCFEAFLRAPPDASYCELNFAPSTQWAAYQFESYRKGRRDLDGVGVPRIDVRSDAAQFELRAALQMDGLPNLAANAVWNLGLAAVIEETNGNLSYWALAQSPDRLDFHRPENFALELAPRPGVPA